ncbi:MAG: isocitrate/isopropylmalate family dehydrogenase [Myxococcota bacterium]
MMLGKIAVIPGDGIGPEVIAEGAELLEALGFELTFFDWGADKWLRDGIGLPKDALKMLSENFDAIYFGALGDKRIPDMAHGREILLGLRLGLDLYINLRPVQLLHPSLAVLKSSAPIDFMVFRENTQDCYSGAGRSLHTGTDQEQTCDESLHTFTGVERIIRQAFEYAIKHGKSSVTLGHKSNAIKFGGALWQKTFQALAREYPNIAPKELYIDTMAMEFVRAPEQFEVIVTSNLFGDILTDLGAGITGGLGYAASANIHPGKISLFEPVHGSAPDIAGKNLANPMAAFLSAGLMMEFLGHHDLAKNIKKAVISAIELCGQKGTREVGTYIRAQIL